MCIWLLHTTENFSIEVRVAGLSTTTLIGMCHGANSQRLFVPGSVRRTSLDRYQSRCRPVRPWIPPRVRTRRRLSWTVPSHRGPVYRFAACPGRSLLQSSWCSHLAMVQRVQISQRFLPLYAVSTAQHSTARIIPSANKTVTSPNKRKHLGNATKQRKMPTLAW